MAEPETIPEYVYFFFDKDGEQVGDRVYAMDDERCIELEAAFPQLAHKRAVEWRRYRLAFACVGEIGRSG